MVDLNDQVDAPIRLQCDSSIVCDMDVNGPDDPCDPEVIRKALEQACASTHGHGDADSALVLPLGLGHHVDHRTARDAALPLTPDIPCAFYEELPYAVPPARVYAWTSRASARIREYAPAMSPCFQVLMPRHAHASYVELKRKIAKAVSPRRSTPRSRRRLRPSQSALPRCGTALGERGLAEDCASGRIIFRPGSAIPRNGSPCPHESRVCRLRSRSLACEPGSAFCLRHASTRLVG